MASEIKMQREQSKSNLIAHSPSNVDDDNEKFKTSGGGDTGSNAGDDLESWVKSRQLYKPENQLDLTETELSEEITTVITTINLNVPRNLVIYNFKESAYVLIPPAGNTVNLFRFDGTALHLESNEAKRQIEEYGMPAFQIPVITAPREVRTVVLVQKKGEEDDDDAPGDEGGAGDAPPSPDPNLDMEEETIPEEEEAEEEQGEEEGIEEEGEELEEGEGEGEVEGEATTEVVEEEAPPPPVVSRKKKLVNQFNFCERAALTFCNPTRGVETQTIPPPRTQFGANCLQWVIHDSYAEDFARQQADQSLSKDKKVQPTIRGKIEKKDNQKLMGILNKKYLKCWQILERMINQNIYDDIAQDYRYWEDPSDEFRETEGTLLPLWKFSYEKTKRMCVTDMLFNPNYYDLYAVCFGSHEFLKQASEGTVCFFTIKNPSFPDYIINCESGVMCVDIHPKYPFLVAVGMYDGNVAVYNLQTHGTVPLYQSVGVNGKHSECVYEIKWGPDMTDGEINFYTVSSDGRVFNWVLMQTKLAITKIITLYLEQGPIEGPDGTLIRLKACGTCLTFHPNQPEIYLIGTEEGFIYKCSISYSSKYLMTYNAHFLSVYRIDFNKYNSDIFASCSGDWRVKVWEDMREEPLFIFDLGASVGDVKWAPYSSTVLAAVTTEGKVFVFDLNVDKYNPICSQPVVSKRKYKPTRLAFNVNLPFIIVGDDKGNTTSLKLSPNLRLMVKPPKKQPWLDQKLLQNQKLERLLSLVRELPEGAVISEAATTVQS